MAKIHTLKISNYKGIKKFEQVFGMTDFICLIGRGDSGKTTILQAISMVLSPQWNISFYDTDFYNCNIEHPIEIEACVYDIPKELLTENKFGLYKSILDSHGNIIDDITQEDAEDNKDVLTIRLIVNKDLEPKWYVINARNQECKEISANDRSKLNVFLISDYIDRHFAWSKGNPLYSLLKQNEFVENLDDPVILNLIRETKKQIDSLPFEHCDKIIENIKHRAMELGLSVNDIKTTIDIKDLSINEEKICLHDGTIPIKQKGKGSKRLLSIAIQSELAKTGSIILIDEIEQGLEPDRARFLAKQLKKNNPGQIFLTTHSNNIIVELEYQNLFLVRQNLDRLVCFNSDFQGCIRNNPEAFFTKKILLCEGATEVGISRALDEYRTSINRENFAILGIGIVDGTGSKLVDYSIQFKRSGYDVCVLCDSDTRNANEKKDNLRNAGIFVVDHEDGNSIEQQLFFDLPWEAIKKLVNYAIQHKGIDSIKDQVKNNYDTELPYDWLEHDNLKIRTAIGKASIKKDNSWFKNINHGEYLGKIWFDNLKNLEGRRLEEEFTNLIIWIEGV